MTVNLPKLRVLFVDDEAEILNGLRLSLRKERKRFDMLFAEGGEEALETLKNYPVDVVCTDLQMPGIDGAQLLTRMVDSYPSVGRVVLSGHAGDEVVLQAMSLAHRFLVKPTDRGSIVDALTKVHSTLCSIDRVDLRETTGGTACLPPDAALYSALTTQLATEPGNIEAVANIMRQDPAMAAKLLQFANSSYIATQPDITSIAAATRMVGLSTMQAIAPHLGCSDEGSQRVSPDQTRCSSIRIRSMLTAQVAGQIARDKQLDSDLAVTAGLLSGIGGLLLEARAPELARSTESKARAEDRPLHEAQQLQLGMDHTELASALLGSWGLPQPIIDLIRTLHTPGCTDSTTFDLSGALHIAYYLAHQSLNQLAADQAYPPQHLDLSYVHTTNISAELREWNDFTRNLAKQMLIESDYKAA